MSAKDIHPHATPARLPFKVHQQLALNEDKAFHPLLTFHSIILKETISA
jgi:hypothetical protein